VVRLVPAVKLTGAIDVVPAAMIKLVNVPVLVMLGCAAVVTVPAVATFRLATCVVEDTMNGAVPVAKLLVMTLAVVIFLITVEPVPLGVILMLLLDVLVKLFEVSPDRMRSVAPVVAKVFHIVVLPSKFAVQM